MDTNSILAIAAENVFVNIAKMKLGKSFSDIVKLVRSLTVRTVFQNQIGFNVNIVFVNGAMGAEC